MELFYIIKIDKQTELRSFDASTMIERIRRARALNDKPSLINKSRRLPGSSPFDKRRIFFKDFD